MKSKYAAILLVSATMAISSAGTAATVYAEPPAMEQPGGQMPGPGGGTPGGEMPDFQNGEAPEGEMPDFQSGEAPNGEMPDFQNDEAPDGEMPDFQNGETPEGKAPNYQNGETSTTEAPDIQNSEASNDEAPDFQNSETTNEEMPNFQNGQAPNAEMPQMQGGQAPNGEMQQMPGGEMPDGKNFVKVTAVENGSVTVEIGGMPAMNQEQESSAEHETKNYDLTGAEILKETEPGKTESATEADITTDSMLEVELNEDGSVKTITIKAKPENLPNGQMPQFQNGEMQQMPGGQAPNGEIPQMPGGESPEGKSFVKVTGIDNNNVTVEVGGMPAADQNQENVSAAETQSYDLSGAEILKESAPGKTASASVSDIAADSMLEIELNEDGSIKTVIIKAKPENMPNGQPGSSPLQNTQETATQS